MTSTVWSVNLCRSRCADKRGIQVCWGWRCMGLAMKDTFDLRLKLTGTADISERWWRKISWCFYLHANAWLVVQGQSSKKTGVCPVGVVVPESRKADIQTDGWPWWRQKGQFPAGEGLSRVCMGFLQVPLCRLQSKTCILGLISSQCPPPHALAKICPLLRRRGGVKCREQNSLYKIWARAF